MTFNDGIRIQRKIARETGLLFLLNSVQRNIRSHDKKKNKKRNTTDYRNIINDKRRRIRKSRIKILKKTINISKRQEQKKRQIILKTKL